MPMNQRRTVRARPNTDLIILPQDIAHHGGIQLSEIQRDNRHPFIGIHISIQFHRRNFTDSAQKAVHQCGLSAVDRLHTGLQNEIQRRLQSGNAVTVQRSRFQRCRHIRGMLR